MLTKKISNIEISFDEQARCKVLSSEKLSPYADFILADWPEGTDHWIWVLLSDDEEILDWVWACQD